MNFKKLLPAAIITVSAMGLIVPSTISMTAEVSQAQVRQSRNPEGRKFRKFEALNLTEDQKAQVKEIMQSYREKKSNIFTDEQKEILRNAKQQGRNRRQVMRSLNLTEGQRSELRELKTSMREEISEILTEEQKQKLEEMRQKRQSRGRRGRRF